MQPEQRRGIILLEKWGASGFGCRKPVGWDKRSAGPPPPQRVLWWAGAALVPPYAPWPLQTLIPNPSSPQPRRRNLPNALLDLFDRRIGPNDRDSLRVPDGLV